MKKGKNIKMTALFFLSLTLLVACSNDEDSADKVADKLSSKYDTTFEITKEYKPQVDKDGSETQKGIAKSQEGYYVEYTYNLESNTIQDNYNQAKFNKDTSKDIGKYLNMSEDSYVLHSYINGNNILEVVLALKEGVTHDAEKLQSLADTYLSPVAEISVYSLSDGAFSSLKKDYTEKGMVTNKTIKGYLFTDKVVYTTEFDVDTCFEDKELATTDRCIDYRQALNIGELKVDSLETSVSEETDK